VYLPRVVDKYPDTLDARLFSFVVPAVAPAVAMDEAASLMAGDIFPV